MHWFLSLQLRIALRKAEEHARHQSFEAPPELIDLLKRTYHIEEAAFEVKRKSAENAMLVAKEQVIRSPIDEREIEQRSIISRWTKFQKCKKVSLARCESLIRVAWITLVNWSVPPSRIDGGQWRDGYILNGICRARLAEVQEEYEERETRWNRIASLLDRDDLISNTSSLSTATNLSLNNGLNATSSTNGKWFLRPLSHRTTDRSLFHLNFIAVFRTRGE